MMQHTGSPAPLEEGSRKDKGYRRYASNVERALSLFDTALQEWADYIAFLGRLLKALQSKPTDTSDIPHDSIVAKRLAQCLSPMLGAGVHQKTLEVYAYVFSILGEDGLSRDLSLWLPGLSPTLSFASLSIKPTLLGLFETYIVPLSPLILRSAIKAIVLALLPGLEEETSEEFERTLVLLNKFRSAVSQSTGKTSASGDVAGDQYFWQSLFLASITSSTRRQGALAYLIRELPRMGKVSSIHSDPETSREMKGANPIKHLPPEIQAVTSPEPGLLIRCFAIGLQDEQLLIQRGFLDLLVSHLPLHSVVFRERVTSEDLGLLVMAAASVVARREMSLNRRLWSWLLGPETPSEKDETASSSPSSPDSVGPFTSVESGNLSQIRYFERYGLDYLSSGILKLLNNDTLAPSEKAKPFRICLSLMDRWEIGGLIVPRIFLPAMESIWRYQRLVPAKDALAEILRSAKVFFDGIESGLIWAELTLTVIRVVRAKVEETPSEAQTKMNPETLLHLLQFIITHFNLQEEEMITLHIPIATLTLLISLRYCLEESGAALIGGDSAVHTEGCKVAAQLLDAIPQRIFAALSISEVENSSKNGRQMLREIQQFYEDLRSGSEDIAPSLHINVIREAILHNASQIALVTLSSSPIRVDFLEQASSLLEKILRKMPALDEYEYGRLMSSLTQASKTCATIQAPDFFSTVAAMVSILETIERTSTSSLWDADHRVRQLLPKLLTDLWEFTSPSMPRHNVEAVRCLWRIHSISPDKHLVEGSLASLLFQNGDSDVDRALSIESVRRFAIVWAHSNSITNASSDRHLSMGHTITGRSPNAAQVPRDSVILERPLLLLLDSLFDEETELSMFISSWLHSLANIQRVVDIVICRLHDSALMKRFRSDIAHSQERLGQDAEATSNDAEESLYFLKLIFTLLKQINADIWTSLILPEIVVGTPTKKESSEMKEVETSVQHYLASVCMQILQQASQEKCGSADKISSLRQTSVLLLHRMLTSGSQDSLVDTALDSPLIEILSWSVVHGDILLQVPLMDLILVVLQMQSPQLDVSPTTHRRQTSRETFRSTSQISLSSDKNTKEQPSVTMSSPLIELLDCLILGISSPNSHSMLEQWISFMNRCLPLYLGSAVQSLMPLVDCFIKNIESVFQRLRALFEGSVSDTIGQSEQIAVINVLLNGLEHVLARSHDQLLQDEGHAAAIRSPEQAQGFFGNMVSGVFTPEVQKLRSATANNRLTVLLCFKDAVRLSYSMWSWADIGFGIFSRETATSASFNYTSLRLRNRTRRILEHLFAAEALECLETLVEAWHKAGPVSVTSVSSTVFNLLHALDGSRPKNTIPALFNAIYSRTNPNVLDPVRKSSLTSELSDLSLAIFLVVYTRSMEDDALDEIWSDCMTFLRDVLSNPLPHRQTLPLLLQFTAILGEKINNTNFGEQRKMRRDIGELFVRLLAATFTIKPLSFSQDTSSMANGDDGAHELSKRPETQASGEHDDVVSITASLLPNISKILVDRERIAAATTTISTQIIIPTIRWRAFPHNITQNTLEILKTMSRIPEASRLWRKDVAEAFNDPRFFHTSSMDVVQRGWMPVLRQWVLLDKDRMTDLLSRLSSPASAGIMFGVGASSARLEADRKAQLNLRRIALVILSADHDTFVVNLNSLQEKLVDLMTATVASSPSLTTRAEVYMVLRSLIQRITPVHLASLWPIISTELHEALCLLNSVNADYLQNVTLILQAAKLLDTLLLISPDDFQLREWLFISDTIDAVYRPADWRPRALADELAEALDAGAGTPQSAVAPSMRYQQGRQPLLTWEAIHTVPKENLIDRVLRPFLRQLSIMTFESTYKLEAADLSASLNDLLQDLFDETTLV